MEFYFSGGIQTSRSKPYVLDPSVQSGHLGSFGMQTAYGGSQHLYQSSPAMQSVPQAPVAPADIYNPQGDNSWINNESYTILIVFISLL